MDSKVRVVLAVACLALSVLPLSAQGLSTSGREFVLAFPYQPPPEFISGIPHQLLVTSDPALLNLMTSASVRHSRGTDTSPITSLLPGAVFEVPATFVTSGNGSDAGQAAILVTSTADVTVTAVETWSQHHCDSFLVLPTESLGQVYFALTFNPDPGLETFIAVTAIANTTNVTLTFGVDTVKVILEALETYQLTSTQDLTGLRVDSDRPVSVISGVLAEGMTSLSTNYNDMTLTSLTPAVTWGRYHVTFGSPGLTARSSTLYQVVARQGNTHVKVTTSDSMQTSLHILAQAGDFVSLQFPADSMQILESTHPVTVVKVMASSNKDDFRLDECLTLIVPTEQWLYSYVVLIPANFEAFLVAIQTVDTEPVTDRLAGLILTWYATGVISNGTDTFYVSVTRNLGSQASQTYKVTSSGPFALYVVFRSFKGGFATCSPAGMGLDVLSELPPEEDVSIPASDDVTTDGGSESGVRDEAESTQLGNIPATTTDLLTSERPPGTDSSLSETPSGLPTLRASSTTQQLMTSVDAGTVPTTSRQEVMTSAVTERIRPTTSLQEVMTSVVTERIRPIMSLQEVMTSTAAEGIMATTSLQDEMTSPRPSTQRCFCQRQTQCYVNATERDLMLNAVRERAEMTSERLKVNKHNLSATKRRLSSAKDFRPSAQGVGSVLGIGTIVAVVAVLILPDVATLLTHVTSHLGTQTARKRADDQP